MTYQDRIRELEVENQGLKQEIVALKKKQHIS